MQDFVESKVKELESKLIEIRRYLHENPELSGQEFNTANYINTNLLNAGIKAEIIPTDSGPAVIATIGTDAINPTIAFRADIDALPLSENTKKPYTSKISGVMHACGHDFNMVSVLGTGFVLQSFLSTLNVNVKLIFQPSEESTLGGASDLIKHGIMDKVKAIFTIHSLPTLEAGKIGIIKEAATASIDSFKIKITGKSGHSARPHESIDSIFIANQIMNDLYSTASRNFNPLIPIVFSIGKIQGGTAANIISGDCLLEGTVRTFSPTVRKNIESLVKLKAAQIAVLHGAIANIEWINGSSSVFNNQKLYDLTKKSAQEFLEQENITELREPSMGAEDFSEYLISAPGMLIRIGTGGENCYYPLHSSNFDINESAIGVSVKLLSKIALNYCNFTQCVNISENDIKKRIKN